jgi:hypothetical protein
MPAISPSTRSQKRSSATFRSPLKILQSGSVMSRIDIGLEPILPQGRTVGNRGTQVGKLTGALFCAPGVIAPKHPTREPEDSPGAGRSFAGREKTL